MVGPKERFGGKYDQWYARHKIVEKARQDRIKLEKNPINALPVQERGKLPSTQIDTGLEY